MAKKQQRERKKLILTFLWLLVFYFLPMELGNIIGKYFGFRIIGLVIGGMFSLFFLIRKVEKELEKEKNNN